MSPNLTVAQPRMATCEGTGAELVCQALLAAGVDVLFGVPGDTGVALYDALRSSAELRHVLMNDERGAVFAADAYARCTNRPGVVEVSSGGGATFCIGGLGEALAAAIPMVVISSDIQTSSRGSGALTETDQLGLFAAVTKWRGVAQTAADLPRLIAEAFENAMHGRPGPAVIIVPENVLDERASVRAQCATTLDGPRRVRAHEDNIRQIAEALATAERPVIIAGGGVHLSQAYREIEELAVLTGAAVGTSIHGKGAIAETHPLSLGVIGANGGRDYATDFVSEADFALLVGTRANSTDTDGFRAPPRDAVIAVVDIDLDSRAIHNYPNAYVATGDAATVLAQLVKALPRRAPRSNEILEHHLATLARDWRTRVDLRTSKPPLLAPWQVMERVHAALPSNATVVADCGTPTPYLGAHWQVDTAGRSVVTPRGHGPMGYALPASLGVAAARPADHVLTFTTDGSLVMAAGALETAARNNIPVIVVHFNNGSLGWIKALQHYYHDSRYFNTQLSNFDAVGVAAGFGLEATRVTSLADVSAAVYRALESRRPTFIDVPTPDEHDALPPVASWQRASKGEDIARPAY